MHARTGKWGFKVRALFATMPKYGGNAKSTLDRLLEEPKLITVEEAKAMGRK